MGPLDVAETLTALLDCSVLAATMNPAERGALRTILAAPLAWSWVERPTVAEQDDMAAELKRLRVSPWAAVAWLGGLAAAGHDASTLASLEASGLLARWHDRAVTLSPLAAALLGVELQEFGGEDDPALRWAPLDPRPRPVRLWRRHGECDQAILAGLIATDPGPAEDAIIAEEALLMTEARTASGQLDVDPESGQVVRVPITLFGRTVFIDRRIGPKLHGGKRPKNGPRPGPRENPNRPRARGRRGKVAS